MLTRAKAGIFKTRQLANLSVLSSSRLLSALLASPEPKGFKSASKNPAWLAAMDKEVQALQHNLTWVLVPRPAHTNIVGSKWVFQTKYLPDGSIECPKARLVAKCYTQVPDLDYIDTFSSVIKATTRTSIGATPYSLGYGMEAALPVEIEIRYLRGALE